MLHCLAPLLHSHSTMKNHQMFHSVTQFSGEEFQVILPLCKQDRRYSFGKCLPDIAQNEMIPLPVRSNRPLNFSTGNDADWP